MNDLTRRRAKRQDQLPPHAPEVEAAILGCILYQAASGQQADAVAMLEKLSQSDFYEIYHQTIYSALYSLHLDGKPLDITTVQQRLKDKRQLSDVGGLAYLARLPDAGIPAAFDGYFATLREKASRREAIRLAGEVERLARDEAQDPTTFAARIAELTATAAIKRNSQEEWIRFYTPSECRDYVPPEGHVLVGDCHLVRGNWTVIGGPPGVGKSRGGDSLAVAGATGADWFGLKVHRRFKTLIIQNENGRFRLKSEFSEIHGDGLDTYIRVSEPPAYGMAFDKAEFRAALIHVLEEFKPDVIIIDPWNSVARDDKGKDYLDAFQAIREVLPKGDNAPAMVIVGHTRKPRPDERANGRALLNLLAGSYVLGSVPRCVFVMQPASDDPEDQRVVWTCCKNNDGALGARSAWYRRNGLFEPCPDFDWPAFDAVGEERRIITLQDMETLFDGGKRQLERSRATAELIELTNLKKTACYAALKLDGKFAAHLEERAGLMTFKP